MKTTKYIDSLVSANREEWISEYRRANAALKTIEEIYGNTCTGNPKETIKECYNKVGKALTDDIIASLINYHGWDGRIGRAAQDWAVKVPGAYDEAACARAHIYTNRIHMSHLDQLARTIIHYTPA